MGQLGQAVAVDAVIIRHVPRRHPDDIVGVARCQMAFENFVIVHDCLLKKIKCFLALGREGNFNEDISFETQRVPIEPRRVAVNDTRLFQHFYAAMTGGERKIDPLRYLRNRLAGVALQFR